MACTSEAHRRGFDLAYSYAKGRVQPQSACTTTYVHEAHVRRRERRCDCREVEIHAARVRGTYTGRGVDQSKSKNIVCIIYLKKHVRFSSDTTRLLIKCSVLHAII
jgi:hypothetical protein